MIIKNQFYIFTLVIIFIIIVSFVVILSDSNCFMLDDYGYSVYEQGEKLFVCLKFNFGHGGGYIGYFFSKFFSFYLPDLLKIHPADFAVFGHGIIKGLFTAIIIFLIAKFSTFFFKSKLLYICSLFWIISYGMFAIDKSSTFVFVVSYNFYRYLFSFLFFSLFWYYIFKHILNKQNKINYKHLLLMSVNGFVIGTSIELAFFTSITLFCLITSWNLIIKTLSYFKQNIYNKCALNLDWNFYIPNITLIIATLLFTTSQGFKDVASDRGLSNINAGLQEINDFIEVFKQFCFTENANYWILFLLILLTSLIIAIKKQEIKNVLLPILLQCSILTVMFSLVLCGRTNNNEFYLTHNNVMFHYYIQFLFPAFMLFGYFLKNILFLVKSKIMQKIILLCISSILIFTSIITFFRYKEDVINNFKYEKINTRTNLYIYEKIARFYYLQNKTPKLPPDVYQFDNTAFYLEKQDECSNENGFSNSYYPYIYKDNISNELGFCIYADALEEFHDAGGTFSEEELSNIKFQRLFDEDFILNKSKT